MKPCFIDNSNYSDHYSGYGESSVLFSILRIAYAEALGVEPQIGTVAYYAATVYGERYSLPSVRIIAISKSQTTGVLRGRIGIHQWNISIPQAASKSLQIVRNQFMTMSHF